MDKLSKIATTALVGAALAVEKLTEDGSGEEKFLAASQDPLLGRLTVLMETLHAAAKALAELEKTEPAVMAEVHFQALVFSDDYYLQQILPTDDTAEEYQPLAEFEITAETTSH